MSNPEHQPAELSLEATDQLAVAEDRRWELISDHYVRYFPSLPPIAHALIRLFDVKEVIIDEDFDEDISYDDAEDLLRDDLLDEITDLEARYRELIDTINNGAGDEHCHKRAADLLFSIQYARADLEFFDLMRDNTLEEVDETDYSQIWWDWGDISPYDTEKFGATPPPQEFFIDWDNFDPELNEDLNASCTVNFTEPLEET